MAIFQIILIEQGKEELSNGKFKINLSRAERISGFDRKTFQRAYAAGLRIPMERGGNGKLNEKFFEKVEPKKRK